MLDSRGAVRAALVATAIGVSTGAWSQTVDLPDFTFAPSGAGLTGTTFTADNIIISDYSHVQVGAGGSFTDAGYLAVSGFQLDGADINVAGLNDTYGLFFQFSGSGTQTTNDPLTTPNTGTFDSLTYTLYGYNGPAATFSIDPATHDATTTATGLTTLATGTLINGGVSTLPAGGGGLVPAAFVNSSFAVAAGAEAFFASPNPFYSGAQASFINTPQEVAVFSPNDFSIYQGGGSVNFTAVTAPIPEPQTYALMLAGLGAIAFVMKRRRPDDGA